MITSVLEQVSKLLGPTYLISSLTPWLMFWGANGITVAYLIGPTALNRWWQSEVTESTTMLTGVTAGIVLFLAATALVMNSVYTLFQRILEGDANVPGIRLLSNGLSALQCARNRKLLGALERVTNEYGSARALARRVNTAIAAAAKSAIDQTLPNATPAVQDRFEHAFDNAMRLDEDRQAIEGARDAILTLLTHAGPAALPPRDAALQTRINRFVEATGAKASAIATRASERSAVIAAPTQYGETLASAGRYVSTRYSIDSIVFWSRLQPVIAKEYITVVENGKTRMDMLCALTLLSLLYTVVWFVLLTQVGLAWAPLLTICGIGLLAAALFYGGAIDAARSFGETIRSSFDLYRHKLLEQFGFKAPDTLEEEKGMWLQISRFVLYNDRVALPFEPPEPPKPKPAAAAPPAPNVVEQAVSKGLDFFKTFFAAPASSATSTPAAPPAATTPTPPAAPSAAKPTPPPSPPPAPAPEKEQPPFTPWLLDVVVLALSVILLAWIVGNARPQPTRRIVLAPAAAHNLPQAGVIAAEDLTFRLGLSDQADALILDPRELEGRALSTPVGRATFFRQSDLQSKQPLKVIRLTVSVTSEVAANSKIDLWRKSPSPSGFDSYTPLLVGVDVAGAEALPEAAAKAFPTQQAMYLKVPESWPVPTDAATNLIAVSSGSGGAKPASKPTAKPAAADAKSE